jgi:hypothetical protein
MSEPPYFQRHLIIVGAAGFGVLIGLAIHILGQRFGINLGGLWNADAPDFVPASAAIGWWLIAAVAFVGGYITASLMESAVSGELSTRMRQFLIGVGVLLFAAAGQIASAPGSVPTVSAVLAGITALMLGALMAFCGAHFALRRQ